MAAARFRRVAIVGVGLIGGSIALAIRRHLRGARVVGIDRPRVLRRAMARRALDEGSVSLGPGLRGADLVVLALPVQGILAHLPRLSRHLGPETLVTDVGSTKERIVAKARRSGLGDRFVGGHPMAGSERSGVEHAEAGLLAGAPWILCPPARTARLRRRLARLKGFVRSLGARPTTLDPRTHDEVVARLSHLPQLVSVALVNAASRGPSRRSLGLAGPAFRDMSRLATSPPNLWNDILRSNRRRVERALGDLQREIRLLRTHLAGGATADFRRAARTVRDLSARPDGS